MVLVESLPLFLSLNLSIIWIPLLFYPQEVPYAIIILASIILLVQAILVGGINQAYAISVAVVSLVVAIVAIYMSLKMKIKWEIMDKYVAYFMVLWTGAGAVILTFWGPFFATTNSYFAIWAMFISSVVASKLNYQAVTDKVQSASSLGYLMIASTVLIIAILFASNYNWRNLYALAVCIVTLLLCALLIFLESRGSETVKKLQLPILSFFAVIWLFVVIFLTFALGEFNVTSNGFFAAWAGFILSVYAGSTCA
jgi:hypothetical protein